MAGTVSSREMLTITKSTYSSLSMMIPCMTRTVRKFKIFYSVVSFNSINMMNNFIFSKIPAEMFFHNKSMFSNVPVSIYKRMLRGKNKNVTAISHDFSTLPMRVLISTKLGLSVALYTLFGFKSSVEVGIRLKNNLKSTHGTIFSNHNLSLI